MIKIRLVGSKRYNHKGETFMKDTLYGVPDVKAKVLLSKLDDYNRPFFVRDEDMPVRAVVHPDHQMAKDTVVIDDTVAAVNLTKPQGVKSDTTLNDEGKVDNTADTGASEVSDDEEAGVASDTVVLGKVGDAPATGDTTREEWDEDTVAV